MVTALQTDRRQSTEEALAALQTRHDASKALPPIEPETIDAETLASLDLMTKDELIALIKRVSGAMWGYAMMTPEQTAEAMKLKLAAGGLSERDMYKALPLMREWMDREFGKTVQRIEQKNLNVNVSAPKEMTTDEIMARLARASQSALEGAGVRLIGGRVERLTD